MPECVSFRYTSAWTTIGEKSSKKNLQIGKNINWKCKIPIKMENIYKMEKDREYLQKEMIIKWKSFENFSKQLHTVPCAKP